MVGDYFGPTYVNGSFVPVVSIAGPLRTKGPPYAQSMRAAVINPKTVYTGSASAAGAGSRTSTLGPG